MNVGDIVVLQRDVVNSKRRIEGVAGEEVTIVYMSLPALIVVNKQGKRYPINQTHLVKT